MVVDTQLKGKMPPAEVTTEVEAQLVLLPTTSLKVLGARVSLPRDDAVVP